MISNNVSEPKLFDLNLVQFSERNLKNEIDKQQINNILEKIFKQSNEKTKDVSFLDKEDNYNILQQMKTSTIPNERNSLIKKISFPHEIINNINTVSTRVKNFSSNSLFKSPFEKRCNLMGNNRDLIIKLKSKNNEFLNNRRQSIEKTISRRGSIILPQVKNDHKIINNENCGDIYQDMKPISNEQEYIKRFILPRKTYSQKQKTDKRESIKSCLEELIPPVYKSNLSTSCSNIKFKANGNEIVDQFGKSNQDTQITSSNINGCPSLSNFNLTKPTSISGKTSKYISVSTGQSNKQYEKINPQAISTRNIKDLFKYPVYLELYTKLNIEMGKLKLVQGSINKTFKDAIKGFNEKKTSKFNLT